MSFDQRKAATLASLNSSVTDKSPKGTLDTPIIPLINALNSHPNYFTTSSCSGRISLFSHPKNRPKGGAWLYITHDPADAESVVSLLFPTEPTHPAESCPTPNDLVFRFEPLIVAVECRDVESAQSLVSIAVSCGLRESGVASVSKRVIVGIRCSIRLEVPFGENGAILVSREYVRFLVGVANEKMEANRRRTEGFLQALMGCNGLGLSVSTNDENGNHVDEEKVKADDSQFGNYVCNVGITWPAGDSSCSLSATQIMISGDPIEKSYLWGHSACTLGTTNCDYKILVFGGFGGMGRHGRRNDTLLLDPLQGTLKVIHAESFPSPRLGHTSSLVGDRMFVIGGRDHPLNILSDVWVFNINNNAWTLVECAGCVFPPRHRHAAAVVGSKIYVFGGLNNGTIFSSLHVLDSDNLQWEELLVSGELPCARHSHAMVAYGSKLYMFGGFNGEKPLGDFYSFDVHTCLWKREEVAGRTPNARFSHSMFLYKNYLGVIGGCPVGQHYQDLALLDLQLQMWKHVKLDSMSKELFVRSTANVVGDDLIMIGGGAACYAFGSKFSEPIKINLLPAPIVSFDDYHTPAEIGEKLVIHQCEGVTEEKNIDVQGTKTGDLQISTPNSDLNSEAESHSVNSGHQMVASHWVMQLDRKYAKLGKDILKKFGWLDLVRKAYPREDGIHICFPVTQKFCSMFHEKQHFFGAESEGLINLQLSKPFTGEGVLLNEISCSTALHLLEECGSTKQADEVVEVRRTSKSPLTTMTEAVASLIQCKGLSPSLLEQLPSRWERLGDIVVLPVTSFKDPVWDSIGEKLWPTIAKSLKASRLARQGRVASTGTRDSTLEMLVGDNGWVNHCENGILYSFDATKCMFSWGNLSEKLRMGCLDCRDEVIVDLFAGIGYFVLPFLVRAKAKLVYACEWNPHAVEALQHNLKSNAVSDRCIVLEGDNRITAPKGVADRVCLGLIPTSENSWVAAVRALRTEGGTLHVHGNVKDSEESSWSEHVSKSIYEIAASEGHSWEVTVEHVERVKWYAPHIRHLVADVRCRKMQR
ncbi:tRNA wybutosine-synthesizing protein 2/3/4 isoform X1 [Pistacia vera]|uniref:tRNA wybutosine-synthesizing protein 2/3/4 isoform X1 n=1 Tax=Pistacia vera TaxID=55513 RepID=UPI001263146A|nr:tRNA wybutosine-synthesizing protein 2/3/4 isoform X1 [Pistacia vera]